MSKGSVLGLGMNAYFAMDTYHTAREEGAGKLGASAKAVGEAVMFDVMGMPMYFGMQAVAALPKAAITTYEGL